MTLPSISSPQDSFSCIGLQWRDNCRIPLSLGIASSSACLETALQKVLWLKGTLGGSCASVHNAHKAAVKLSHSLLQSSTLHGSQTRRQPLTIHNLFLLCYPEQLALYLKRLEWHTASLKNLLQWEQHETVFWQWMQSVLDEQSRQADTHERLGWSRASTRDFWLGDLILIGYSIYIWLSKERPSQLPHTVEHLMKPQTQVLLSLPPVPLESTVYQPPLESSSCHGAFFKQSAEGSIDLLVTRTEEWLVGGMRSWRIVCRKC